MFFVSFVIMKNIAVPRLAEKLFWYCSSCISQHAAEFNVLKMALILAVSFGLRWPSNCKLGRVQQSAREPCHFVMAATRRKLMPAFDRKYRAVRSISLGFQTCGAALTEYITACPAIPCQFWLKKSNASVSHLIWTPSDVMAPIRTLFFTVQWVKHFNPPETVFK